MVDFGSDLTIDFQAMNNGLELELERCAGLEVRLQVLQRLRIALLWTALCPG